MPSVGDPIVLASASPRRAELLASAGYRFIVRPVDIDETAGQDEPPRAYVQRIANAKAQAAAAHNPDAVILAADTTVVVDGLILGKPADATEATAMLARLSGRVHEVLTGVVLVIDNRMLVEVAQTRVHMTAMTREDIAWYVASGEPDGKAGAYAIQGRAARFIDWIDCSWSNVVGLPIATVARMLRQAGVVS
jgi:septum formation protein